MKQLLATMFLIGLTMMGCKKDETTTGTDEFNDILALGTGLNATNLFQLTGESTTFQGVPKTIYWRLESQADMAGSAVSIKIEKLSGGVYSSFNTFNYNNPQTYGHIMLSSFSITQTGSFRATGILSALSKTVATKDFIVQ
jgi:hypothetical protein